MKIDEHKDDGVVASFSFIDSESYLDRSVEGMYRCLISQLVDDRYLEGNLSLTWLGNEPKQIVWTKQGKPYSLIVLKQLLSAAILGQADTRRYAIILIDGLDKCDEHQARDTLRFFSDLSRAVGGSRTETASLRLQPVIRLS